MNTNIKYLIFSISVLFFGCQFSTTRINNKSDEIKAGRQISDFYQDLKQSDYKKTNKFFVDSFFKSVPEVVLYNFYAENESKYGKINKVKLVKSNTKSVNGKRVVCKYTMQYTVSRSITTTYERFFLLSVNDGKPKIVRYEVTNDTTKRDVFENKKMVFNLRSNRDNASTNRLNAHL